MNNPLEKVRGLTDYNPFYDDLADWLILMSPGGDWERSLMASLTAYLDESESKGEKDPVVSVAGFIATGFQWYKFARAWNAVLESKGVEVFHTCEFETEKGRRGTVYENWTGQERKDFQNALINVISSNLMWDVGVGLSRSTYKKVMTPERERFHGDIYVLCAKLTLIRASVIGIHYWKQAPSLVIERGGGYEHDMERAFDEVCRSETIGQHFRQSTFSKRPKSKLYPHLQAADYFAFNVSKGMSHLFDFEPPADAKKIEHAGHTIRAPRYPIERLNEAFGGFHTLHTTAEELEGQLRIIEKGAGFEGAT